MTQLPPGPRAPAVVNTANLVRRPLESLLGWHRRYGDVFTVEYLIFGTGVCVADPVVLRGITLVPRHGTPVAVHATA